MVIIEKWGSLRSNIGDAPRASDRMEKVELIIFLFLILLLERRAGTSLR